MPETNPTYDCSNDMAQTYHLERILGLTLKPSQERWSGRVPGSL